MIVLKLLHVDNVWTGYQFTHVGGERDGQIATDEEARQGFVVPKEFGPVMVSFVKSVITNSIRQTEEDPPSSGLDN